MAVPAWPTPWTTWPPDSVPPLAAPSSAPSPGRPATASSLKVSRQDAIVSGEHPRSPARCEVRKRCRQTAKSAAVALPCLKGRDDVPEDALEAGDDVRAGRSGQPQVAAGAGDRGMTHAGLQDRQQRADVVAAGEPRPQLHRLMAQIVDSGAVTPPAVGNAGLPQEPAEVPVDVHERQRESIPAGEEPLPAGAPGDLRVVAGEPFA